jgi:polyisoprenoid-binding protein YceI
MSTWNIDTTHSGINFSVRHMVVSKVRGRFAKYSGALQIDDSDLSRSTAEITIEAASIDTGVVDRDKHLRSPDFFDVEKYPTLTYRLKSLEKVDAENYRGVGELSIHGVTREVPLAIEFGGQTKDPYGNQRMGFSAKTHIERKDFGLTWNMLLEAGGLTVGDRIDIEIELEAIKAA